MNTADIIKKRREELGLSQEELAAKLGYKSRSSINKIELGLSDIPFSKIPLFAKALEIEPEILMGWEEKPNEEETTRLESPRFRWVARNAKKMTDEDLERLQKLMEVAFSEIDFDEED